MKENKLVFEEPKLGIVRFEAEDIITSSDELIVLPGTGVPGSQV